MSFGACRESPRQQQLERLGKNFQHQQQEHLEQSRNFEARKLQAQCAQRREAYFSNSWPGGQERHNSYSDSSLFPPTNLDREPFSSACYGRRPAIDSRASQLRQSTCLVDGDTCCAWSQQPARIQPIGRVRMRENVPSFNSSTLAAPNRKQAPGGGGGGGQRMALKLAGQQHYVSQQQIGPPLYCQHRWQPSLAGARQIYAPAPAKQPVAAGYSALECAEQHESECSCSDSIECLSLLANPCRPPVNQLQLHNSQPALGSREGRPSSSTNQHSFHHRPFMPHVQPMLAPQLSASVSSSSSPPQPPQPPLSVQQMALPAPLVGQSTYTASPDTITDSMMVLGPQHQDAHQIPQTPPPPPILSAAGRPNGGQDFNNSDPNPASDRIQNARHPDCAANLEADKRAAAIKQHKHHKQTVSFRRSATEAIKAATFGPPGSAGGSNGCSAERDKLYRQRSAGPPSSTGALKFSGDSAAQQQQQQQSMSNERKQTQTDNSRVSAGGGTSGTNSGDKTFIANKTKRAGQLGAQHTMAMQTCPTSPIVTNHGQLHQNQHQHRQQQQSRSSLAHLAGYPAGPIPSAASVVGAAAAPRAGHLLASGNTIDGPISLPAITSHRTNSPWMRISSIILTPVGIVIVLFIVVSPLLHYLM